MLLLNLGKAKDNLIGVGGCGGLFLKTLRNDSGFGGREGSGGGGCTTTGLGWKGIEINGSRIKEVVEAKRRQFG